MKPTDKQIKDFMFPYLCNQVIKVNKDMTLHKDCVKFFKSILKREFKIPYKKMDIYLNKKGYIELKIKL